MGISESKLRALYKKAENETLNDFYMFFSIVAGQQPMDLAKSKSIAKEKKIEKIEMSYDSFKQFFDVPYDEITKSFFRIFDDKNTLKATFFTFASKMLAYPTLNEHEKAQLAFNLINTENRSELKYEDFNLLVNATYEKNITISELIQELQAILFPSTTMPLSFADFEKYSTKPKNYVDVIIEGYFYLFPAFCLPWFVKQKRNIPMLSEALKKERVIRVSIENKKKEDTRIEEGDPLERKLKEIEEKKKNQPEKKTGNTDNETPVFNFDNKKDPLFEKDEKDWFDSEEDKGQQEEEEIKKKVNIKIELKEGKTEEKKKVKAISFAFGAKPTNKNEGKEIKKIENEMKDLKKALELIEKNKIEDAESSLKKCFEYDLTSSKKQLIKSYFLMCEIIDYNEMKESEEGMLLNCFLMILPVLRPHRRLAIALAIDYLTRMNCCIASVSEFLNTISEKQLKTKQIVNKCWKCGKDKTDLNDCSCGETFNIVCSKKGIQIGGNNVWKCEKCGLLIEGEKCVLCGKENRVVFQENKVQNDSKSEFEQFSDFGFGKDQDFSFDNKNVEVEFDNYFANDNPSFNDFTPSEKEENNPIIQPEEQAKGLVMEQKENKESEHNSFSKSDGTEVNASFGDFENNEDDGHVAFEQKSPNEPKQEFGFDDFFSSTGGPTGGDTFDSDFTFGDDLKKEDERLIEVGKSEVVTKEIQKEDDGLIFEDEPYVYQKPE